ncbi:hypothetical protein [Carboxylicivirga marina]|uniref:Helix-turn-helix type 11 domain-containing protein n=1 Tax=Carboxylicivirga marina TaxID=2800988 RepID=A0ABS1HED3_9BACT|nr:hypothetical protein [Carboxylicivirga marina]MBK3515982.1 hypothetical protein [Carboxylicivirga marina]
MKLFDELKVLRRMFDLIEKEQTGCTCTFPKKLGISRGKLYNLLDELKDIGIIIKYCKKQKTFYFKDAIKIKVAAPIQILKADELSKINGGIYTSVHFFGQVLF